MKLSNNIIKKFQDGGAAPAPDPSQGGGAPAGGPPAGDPSQGGGDPSQGGGGGDPVAQLLQMAQQALQSKDCNSALAVCDGFLQLISQAQQGQDGGGAPAQGGAPGGDQGAPVYKRGGVMVRRTK